MKKYLALFLTMVMGASVLAGCGGSDSAKTFTVGFDAEYPPYGYRTESGDYAGFDLDLAAEVCERNGWELVKQPIDWDAKDMELNSGAIDCIWNGFTMTGREDEYTFSKPYVDNSIVYVVRADSDIQTEADLAGKHVITQAGSSALSALQDESKADVVNSAEELCCLWQQPKRSFHADLCTAFLCNCGCRSGSKGGGEAAVKGTWRRQHCAKDFPFV